MIKRNIWSYPPDAVLGPTLVHIPIEELFFFVIQTYGVCLLYLCVSKPTFYPVYLNLRTSSRVVKTIGFLGQAVAALGIYYATALMRNGGQGTYLGLILLWSLPFALLQW